MREPQRDRPFSSPSSGKHKSRFYPSSTLLWIVVATVCFCVAVVLAFMINRGDSTVPAPSSVEAIVHPDLVLPDPSVDQLRSSPNESFTKERSATISDPVNVSPKETLVVAEDDLDIAETRLSGFTIPIVGACLSDFEGHLPGAPREYRDGIHEGIDFYSWAACTDVGFGEPVLAAKDGRVLRADIDYSEITAEEIYAAEAIAYKGPEILDRFRGRQVWLDHGNGVVTRYAHLSAIAFGIEEGTAVDSGRIIGFVGESGTPESVFAPGTDYHLHFEIRIGEDFLGVDLDPIEARLLYQDAFTVDE